MGQMNDSETIDVRAEVIAECVNEFLTSLRAEAGISIDAVLAAAHGEIVAMMASRYGGDVAAERCLSAAVRIRQFMDMVELAEMPAAGSA